MMRYIPLVLRGQAAIVVGCLFLSTPLNAIYYGEPEGRSTESWSRFAEGLKLFSKIWSESDGIDGPFNGRSCLSCHSVPMPGGSGTSSTSFVFVEAVHPDVAGGEKLRRFYKAGDGLTEIFPGRDAARRKAPSLFGLTLLEAVPSTALTTVPVNDFGVVGRISGNPERPGRFGWKANVSTIDQSVTNALTTEIGLSDKRAGLSSAVKILADYVRSLRPPPKRSSNLEAEQQGGLIFEKIGCALCHRAELQAKIINEASSEEVVVQAYTDLLLHDMGEELADKVSEGGALRSEFRTAPLWGISSAGPPYLHDGRASDLNSAIIGHGGEGEISRQAYGRLPKIDRENLLAFLRSL